MGNLNDDQEPHMGQFPQTFTTLCAKSSQLCRMAVHAVQAESLERASELGIARAAEELRCAPSEIHCCGVYEGDITVLNWD